MVSQESAPSLAVGKVGRCETPPGANEAPADARNALVVRKADIHLAESRWSAVTVHDLGVRDRIRAEPRIAIHVRVAFEVRNRCPHVRFLLRRACARVTGEFGEPNRLAKLFEPLEVASRLEVIAQRRQIAIVPMHRDVIDLAIRTGGEKVLQILVRVGSVALRCRSTEVHSGPNDGNACRGRVGLQRGPIACRFYRRQVRLREEVWLVEAEHVLRPTRERRAHAGLVPDHRNEFDSDVGAAAFNRPIVPPAYGWIKC